MSRIYSRVYDLNGSGFLPAWLEMTRNGTGGYGVSVGSSTYSAIKRTCYSMGLNLAGKIILKPWKVSNVVDYVAAAPLALFWVDGCSQLLCKLLIL
jgi:hypothetical protein